MKGGVLQLKKRIRRPPQSLRIYDTSGPGSTIQDGPPQLNPESHSRIPDPTGTHSNTSGLPSTKSKRNTMGIRIHNAYTQMGVSCSLDPNILQSVQKCVDFLHTNPPCGLGPLQLDHVWKDCRTKSQIPVVDDTTSGRDLLKVVQHMGFNPGHLDPNTRDDRSLLVQLILSRGVTMTRNYKQNQQKLLRYVKKLEEMCSVKINLVTEGRDQAVHSLNLHGVQVYSCVSTSTVSVHYVLRDPSGSDITDWSKIQRHYSKICQLERLHLWCCDQFVDTSGELLEHEVDVVLTTHQDLPFTNTSERESLDSLPLGSNITQGGKIFHTPVQEVSIRSKQDEHAGRHYFGFEYWQDTLHMECCGCCDQMGVVDKSIKDPEFKSVCQPFMMSRTDGLRRCKLCVSAHQPLKWTHCNKMTPDPAVPYVLSCLTHVEGQLIARCIPMMKINILRKGGTSLGGNAIAFHSPVTELATHLPLLPSELQNVYVVRGLVNDEDTREVMDGAKKFRIRRQYVLKGLEWLQQNNPAYADIVIDPGRVNCLPVNGTVFDNLHQGSSELCACDSGRLVNDCLCHQYVPPSDDTPSQQLPECCHCHKSINVCSCFIAPVHGVDGQEDGDIDVNLGPAPN